MGEGFFGKVKNLIGIEEIEEEEVVEVEEQEQPKAPVQERTVIEPRSFVQPRKEKEAPAVKEDKDQRAAANAVSRATAQFKMIVLGYSTAVFRQAFIIRGLTVKITSYPCLQISPSTRSVSPPSASVMYWLVSMESPNTSSR